jgi:GAF domain-containing protein
MTDKSRDLADIEAIWERTNNAPAAFAQLAICLLTRPGYHMLSVSRWDSATRYLRRVFSTHESIYPIGGRKQKLPSEWSDIVLKAMKPHLSPNIETIRLHFDDHELIESVGIHAILNVPIIDGTTCLGTMNLMKSCGSYEPSDIDRAMAAAKTLRGVLR